MNKEIFIEKSKSRHGDKYDYSKVVYVNSKIKVTIICKEHDEFKQTPNSHLKGRGCMRCYKEKPLKEFKLKLIEKFGKYYDLSTIRYKNVRTPVKVICPIHGEFKQTPIKLLSKSGGCTTCNFINKSNKIHNKYDYSKVEYKNNREKVTIICKEHGEFKQTPYSHLNGSGCSECYGNKKLTNSEIINKFKKIHDNKYDYSKVVYLNYESPVVIICPEHGEFRQTPHSHLNHRGCNKCGYLSNTLTTEEFIKRSIKIHGTKYDYNKFEYSHNKKKSTLVCTNHGEFKIRPNDHLFGVGCPKCKSSKGEKEVRKILNKHNIEFKEQHTFDDCRYIRPLKFDFYLPDYNMCIEYDGIQHFKVIESWGSDRFNEIKRNDNIKNEYCEKNNIRLIRIPYYLTIQEITEIIEHL